MGKLMSLMGKYNTVLLLGAAHIAASLPQDCAVSTTTLVQPTRTATYLSTEVVTVRPTVAKYLGTFTFVTNYPQTVNLTTLTSTITTYDSSKTTVYTTRSSTSCSVDPTSQAGLEEGSKLRARQDKACTITATTTKYYGQTYTFIPANATRTYSAFTAFTQETVTSTDSRGTAYQIATAATTVTTGCPTIGYGQVAGDYTVTQDARCAPTALISSHNGFGLEYQNDTPASGAHWMTSTSDAAQCCQLCAEQTSCAASSWDIRNGQCKLEFPVDFESGKMNCGEGLLVFYGAGPVHPMAPGTGLFVAELCGHADFANAKPDDGS